MSTSIASPWPSSLVFCPSQDVFTQDVFYRLTLRGKRSSEHDARERVKYDTERSNTVNTLQYVTRG